MAYKDVIFKEYDIRGIVGEQFDFEFAYRLGRAFAAYHSSLTGRIQPHIAVGYDARASSTELFKELSRGLREAGCEVINLGMVTTPMSYFSNFAVSSISGSIMITGSHNPPEYNGFKLCIHQHTLFGQEIQRLKEYVELGSTTRYTSSLECNLVVPTFKELYLKRYSEEFGQLPNIPVVMDCGNGVAGVIVRNMFERVGLTPKILFEEPDSTFPNHHPDPTVEKNLEDLKKEVIASGAVVGIGFDGDADRIGIVDHMGKMVYGDELLVIYARDILAKTPGAKIIGDVKCSDRLYKDISHHGGKPIMWKTGHSLIKEKIEKEEAHFGGEMSGHIFFADRNYGYDDAIYAALRLVEILAKTGKTIPELLEGLPASFSTPEIRIDTTEEKKIEIIQALKHYFSEKSDEIIINELDGIRVSYKDGWGLARCSNTQPVLVLRFESNSQEGLTDIQKEFENIVRKYL